MPRTILHADMDAFYASVEQLDNPELRGKPVAVGGSPESRGVVAAASYEARRFGVRSAMPMSRAVRLCPDLVRVPPRFGRYGELSRRVMMIFRSVTPLVEPLSLDEAFLDATEEAPARGGAEALSRWLKDEVRAQTALTVSIGGGTNKTIAKIASDAGKPDGLLVVPAGDEAAFLRPFPARALWGVGVRAEAALDSLAIRTIGDLANADLALLERTLGSRGPYLQRLARGEDDRAVETDFERKSIGAETTFARDLPDGDELRADLGRLADEVARRLHHHGSQARTVTLKLRYANFRTITRSATRREPTDQLDDIRNIATSLFERVVEPRDRFRLLGIQCSHLVERNHGQLSLWRPQETTTEARH